VSEYNQCVYRHDISDEGRDVEIFEQMDGEEWSCQHPVGEDSKYCPFHQPVEEKEDQAVVERFLEVVNTGYDGVNLPPQERFRFLGAEFGDFSLPLFTTIATSGQFDPAAAEYPLDMRDIHVEGALHWSQTTIRHGLLFDGAFVGGEMDFSEATVEGKCSFTDGQFASLVRFDDVEISGSLSLDHAEFELAITMAATAVDGGVTLEDSHVHTPGKDDERLESEDCDSGDIYGPESQVGENLTFSSSKIEGDARFVQSGIGGWAEFNDATIGGAAEFNDATIERDVNFNGATIERHAEFKNADIDGWAQFNDATIGEYAKFNDATIERDAEFKNADIDGWAEFNDATIVGAAEFNDATIERNANFNDATIERHAEFENADIGRWAEFNDATIGGFAEFKNADIDGYAKFKNADIDGWARFNDATINESAQFENADIDGYAKFNEATIERHAEFENADIDGYAEFKNADIDGYAEFNDATIGEYAKFNDATIERDAEFKNADIGGDAEFGSATVERVTFQDAEFRDDATLSGDFGEDPSLTGLHVDGTLTLDIFHDTGAPAVVDMTDATVESLAVADDARPPVLDLADASIGRFDEQDLPDAGVLFRWSLSKMEFTQFDFTESRDALTDIDWDFHSHDQETREALARETVRNRAAEHASLLTDLLVGVPELSGRLVDGDTSVRDGETMVTDAAEIVFTHEDRITRIVDGNLEDIDVTEDSAIRELFSDEEWTYTRITAIAIWNLREIIKTDSDFVDALESDQVADHLKTIAASVVEANPDVGHEIEDYPEEQVDTDALPTQDL